MNNTNRLTKLAAVLGVAAITSSPTFALTLQSKAFKNNGVIPTKYTYCQSDGKGGIKPGKDISPPLSWSQAPKGTKSFVLLVTDPYIPNVPYFDLLKHKITAKAPRMTGYHWILANIPAKLDSLPSGAGSDGFVEGGKEPGKTKYGLMGVNVFSGVFQAPIASRIEFGKKYKDGIYGRYDGPCPPWNDDVIHSYVFTLYALNVKKLNLPKNGHFSGSDVVARMHGHILAQAILHGKYSTNPAKKL